MEYSVQFSCSIMSSSLRPHGLYHTRPPCPSPTPRVYSNSCPLSWWCHPIISSSVIHFSCFPVFSAIPCRPAPPPCPLASPVYPPKEVMDLWSSEILSVLNFGVNIFQLCCLSSRETFFLDKHLWLREPSNRLETWGLWVLTLGLPWHSVWPWAIHLISVQTLWCLITGFSRNPPANKDIWNHSLVPQGKATLHYPSGF